MKYIYKYLMKACAVIMLIAHIAVGFLLNSFFVESDRIYQSYNIRQGQTSIYGTCCIIGGFVTGITLFCALFCISDLFISSKNIDDNIDSIYGILEDIKSNAKPKYNIKTDADENDDYDVFKINHNESTPYDYKPAGVIKCPKCGEINTEGTRYCICGYKLM